jgi:predicted PurR-regulated permease PerM
MNKPAAPAKPPTGADHEHVERMSTWMAILLVILVAVLINQLQLILLPFAISGLIAYVCTPAIEWLAARTRLPRALYAWRRSSCWCCLLRCSGRWAYPR